VERTRRMMDRNQIKCGRTFFCELCAIGVSRVAAAQVAGKTLMVEELCYGDQHRFTELVLQ